MEEKSREGLIHQAEHLIDIIQRNDWEQEALSQFGVEYSSELNNLEDLSDSELEDAVTDLTSFISTRNRRYSMYLSESVISKIEKVISGLDEDKHREEIEKLELAVSELESAKNIIRKEPL